ncbi:phage portal protein family protein [Pseudoalteromonas luteoviolacea]|uniref:phage portal protein family protein n=1 Tax=Pseudoalteromonas luteoviolacea TaxID=43657 RepID=UPI0011505871|nr:DUF935 family protein [Pseudoalteromonas luteoviolacea]TQF71795.1 DUF935 family protein [Pseudoalteromonas luteoviolacea]
MQINHSTLTTPLSEDNPIIGHYPQPGQVYDVPTFNSYWGAINTMMQDDQIIASLELRKSRALAKPTKWVGDDNAIALIKNVLSNLTFTQDQMDGLSMLELGFNPCEIQWAKSGNEFYVESIEKRTPEKFRIGQQGQLLFSDKNFEFKPVPDKKVMLFTRNATRETPYGESVLKGCYPHWAAKWEADAQVTRLGKKYSIPSFIALTDTDDEADLARISLSLAGLENGDGIATSGVKEIITLTATGKLEELIKAIDKKDKAISKVITGQTLAQGESQYGTQALGKVHENTLEAYAIQDLKLLLNRFNRTLFRWILELNGLGHLNARLLFDDEAYKESQKAQSSTGQPLQLSNPGTGYNDPSLNLHL